MEYKVLIVDDSVENINILKGILENSYQLMAATNGATALKICEKQKPHLLLLDIEMPEMDGYEVCLRLKANPLTENIPVVFVTSKDKEVDEAKGFAMGAADYVTKPVSPLIVLARIKTQIALNNQKMELKQQVREQTKEINETRLEIIKRLGKAVEFKDKTTGFHVERVSKYAHCIARSYGMDEFQAEMILNATPMHDIGKIGVAENIIHKEGRLTEDEYQAMKMHCEIGNEILGERGSDIINMAKIIALQHHEKWDGTGYPKGLKGEEINIFARVVAVADVFDALTTRRSYKNAWTNEKAVELIDSEKNKHFDPEVVGAFLNILDDIYKIQSKYPDFAD